MSMSEGESKTTGGVVLDKILGAWFLNLTSLLAYVCCCFFSALVLHFCLFVVVFKTNSL